MRKIRRSCQPSLDHPPSRQWIERATFGTSSVPGHLSGNEGKSAVGGADRWSFPRLNLSHDFAVRSDQWATRPEQFPGTTAQIRLGTETAKTRIIPRDVASNFGGDIVHSGGEVLQIREYHWLESSHAAGGLYSNPAPRSSRKPLHSSLSPCNYPLIIKNGAHPRLLRCHHRQPCVIPIC